MLTQTKRGFGLGQDDDDDDDDDDDEIAAKSSMITIN